MRLFRLVLGEMIPKAPSLFGSSRFDSAGGSKQTSRFGETFFLSRTGRSYTAIGAFILGADFFPKRKRRYRSSGTRGRADEFTSDLSSSIFRNIATGVF